MTDTTQPAAPALDDDVRVLRESSRAALEHTATAGSGWWSASEITTVDERVIAAPDADHIEACDPARIARVLDALEHLQRQVQPYRNLVAALQAERAALQRSAAAASEAVTTLASEREANALLTAEVEQLQRERDEAMAALAAAQERGGSCQCGADEVCALRRERDAAILARSEAAAGAQSGAPQPDPRT